MRIKFFDRLLSAIVGLIILFLGACLFIFGLGIFPFEINLSILNGPFTVWQRLGMVGVALVLLFLGIHSLSLLFRRHRDKGFIMQNTELGDMSISMQAMKNMVKRCIDTHEELKVTNTHIHRTRDGVAVDIRVSLSSGVNIPLTVNALQKQIKHYITSCSGVDVKEVRVMVETSNNQPPNSGEVIAPDLAAADASVAAKWATTEGFPAAASQPSVEPETEKEPLHRRIFKHQDKPQTLPLPPVEEEPKVEAAQIEEPIEPSAEEPREPSAQEPIEPSAEETNEPSVEEPGEPSAEEVEASEETPQEEQAAQANETEEYKPEDLLAEDEFSLDEAEDFESILVKHEEKENEDGEPE